MLHRKESHTKRLLLALLLALTTSQELIAAQDVFSACSQILNDAKRLICYDEHAAAEREVLRSVAPAESAAPANARAEEIIVASDSIARKNSLLSLSKLTADDPNFFGISWDPGSTRRGVIPHLEFDISIKYPLWEFSDEKRLYFIYNGAYDFQARNKGVEIYDSSPVISTKQNPGVAFEWDRSGGNEKFRIGAFHHSIGQTLNDPRDPDRPEATVRAIGEFERIRDAWGEAPALERLSRSSWYAQFRYQRMKNSDGVVGSDWWQYQLEIRPWYFWNDDRIFWPPVPRHQPQIENFDGIRAVGERMISLDRILPFLPGRALARLELQTGLWSPLENVGGRLSLGFNVNNLLISAYYYNGFAKDIAAYHKRTQHAGIGFELR